MPDETTKGLVLSVLANAVWTILNVGLKTVYRWVTRGNSARRVGSVRSIGAAWVILNGACVYLCVHFGPDWCAVLGVLISSTMMAWFVNSELSQFWRVGLVSVDSTIRSGTDFLRALQLATNSLDFLGIGASKLTDHKNEFEAAIARCQSDDRPVRFLLCRPDNLKLQSMARNADKGEESYQQRVKKSLREIANLRSSRSYNIDVRFYKRLPTFRLMFINQTLCLASHYVFGKGSGEDQPQLHVVKLPKARDVDALYFAFNYYFEGLWTDSEEWDYKEYLE